MGKKYRILLAMITIVIISFIVIPPMHLNININIPWSMIFQVILAGSISMIPWTIAALMILGLVIMFSEDSMKVGVILSMFIEIIGAALLSWVFRTQFFSWSTVVAKAVGNDGKGASAWSYTWPWQWTGHQYYVGDVMILGILSVIATIVVYAVIIFVLACIFECFDCSDE
jgi:hypothetical protein